MLVQPADAPDRDRDADEIVQRHIRLLHTYNEIKDGTQALIGKVSWPSFIVLTDDPVRSPHEHDRHCCSSRSGPVPG
jgi:hypothetical protein